MKNFYLPILLFLCICSVTEAQERRLLHHTKERSNLILISTGVGMNFDFLHTGGENALTALADRKTGFPVIDFRLEHFFSKRWGWFADINISLGVGIPIYFGRGIKTGKGGTTRKERMRGIMEQKRKSYGLFPTTKK